MAILAACGGQNHDVTMLLPALNDSILSTKKNERAKQTLRSTMLLVKSGDVVTRTGNDFTSQSLRKLNQRNKTYSHIGIAAWEQDSLFVYHALGGEWNPEAELLREPFLSFGNAAHNTKLGVFRIAETKGLQDSIHAVANIFFKEKLTFDMDFDLKTNDKMYCAEFVAKTLQIASLSQLTIPKSNIRSFLFYGVDDVFLHPNVNTIKEIIYH